MAKRRDLEIALLAVLTASLPGCAGQSIMPSWLGGKSAASNSSSKSLDDLSAQNAAKNSDSSSGDHWQRAQKDRQFHRQCPHHQTQSHQSD